MAHTPVVAQGRTCQDSFKRKWKNPSATPTYNSWRGMRGRCTNPDNPSWGNYGGRGIKVCDRWLGNYDAFVDDMGLRPEGTTLDRINVNGNYEPGNCRWVGWDVQANNKRTNRWLTHNGKTRTLTQWAAHIGVGADTLYRRLGVYQMPIARALTHGTLAPEAECGGRQSYEKGCRCGECRAAHAATYRARRNASIQRRGADLFAAHAEACLDDMRSASEAGPLKVAAFSPRWAGPFIAPRLGLGTTSKTHRLIVSEVLRLMVREGLVSEVAAYDKKAGRHVQVYACGGEIATEGQP